MKNKKIINIYQIIIILISSILIVISHNLKIDWYLKDIVIPFIIMLLSYLIILKNISINKKSFFILIPIVLILASGFLVKIASSNKILNILALTICYTFFFMMLVNENFKLTGTSLKEIYKLFPKKVFANLGYLIPTKKKISNEKIGNAILGLSLGGIIGFVILVLLISADQYFSSFVSKIFSLGNFDVSNIFLLIITFILMFSIVVNIILNKDEKNISVKIVNASEITVCIILSIINFIFLLFLVSEISKLTFNFLKLPEAYTYSSYAREGFFQLLIITIINFSIIMFLKYKSTILETNKKSRILSVVLIIFSILLIFNSYYRMFLYIGNYGFTVLRLQVILFLAMELVVALVLMIRIIKKTRMNDFKFYFILMISFYIINLYICNDMVINLLTR